VQQESPAKKTRLHCDVDNNLISSTTPDSNTPRRTIARRGSLNGRECHSIRENYDFLVFMFHLSLLTLSYFNSYSAEATNHDRSKEKPNGSLEETTAVELPVTSPPRSTLLGTIFSPVFNFFSPAKNGKQTLR